MSTTRTCGAPTTNQGSCGHPVGPAGRCAAGHTSRGSAASLSAGRGLAVATADPLAQQTEARHSMTGHRSNESYAGQDLRFASWDGEPSFHQCDFTGANGTGGRVDGVFTHCAFQEFQGFRSAIGGWHVGSDFTGADLSESRPPAMHGGKFNCDLSSAVSLRQSYHRVDFGSSKVGGSTWTACQFHGADLSGITGIDNARFVGCGYDDSTRFPSGYDPAANGWIHAPDPTGRLEGAWAEIEADAAKGRFNPWRSYGSG